MNDTAAVSVTYRFGKLADEIKTAIQRQLVAISVEVKVEAEFVGLAGKKDGRAEVVVRKGLRFQNAGMAQRAQNLIFTFGYRASTALVGLSGSLRVDSYTAMVLLQRYVSSGPVLPGTLRTLAQKFLHLIITDAP